MHVSALACYPVKSTAPLVLDGARVDRWGIEHDRRWMVVDPSGTTITARTHRRLLQVSAVPLADGRLRLSAPGLPDVEVDVPRAGPTRELTLSRIPSARSAGAAADEWLSHHLHESAQLVWLDDPRRRTVGLHHGGQPGDALSFADAGPILLTSTASLAQVNAWVRQTARVRREQPPHDLPMGRFRPNIVVAGADAPFAEDGWDSVLIGDVEMRFAEHCDRCVLTTIDPVTLQAGKEPVRTLSLHRQWEHKVHFGVRLIPVTTGHIRIGDEVVARTRSAQRSAIVG